MPLKPCVVITVRVRGSCKKGSPILAQEHGVARALCHLQAQLWPGGAWFQSLPENQHPVRAHVGMPGACALLPSVQTPPLTLCGCAEAVLHHSQLQILTAVQTARADGSSAARMRSRPRAARAG